MTARLAAVPLVVRAQSEVRTRTDGPRTDHDLWLVEVQLDRVATAPWWLLTDHPVTTAEEATTIFRMYRARWSIEDVFKVGKQCLGWEDVQVLAFDAVRFLVALGWVAAGFLYELGVTLEWPEVRLLARLGGWEERANRPPGKIVLMRGLRRLLDLLATEAVLAAETRQHGALPPRLAALLGRPPDRLSYVRMSGTAAPGSLSRRARRIGPGCRPSWRRCGRGARGDRGGGRLRR